MKINFKVSMYSLVISSTLFFVGCGGNGGNDDNDNGNVGGTPKVGNVSKFKYNRVSIAGSSITWGQGYLGEKSYVGEVEKYLREEVADTLGPEELDGPSLSENYSYAGKLKKYPAGTEILGSLKASNEITIVYAVKNGVGAVVEMIVDGNSLGDFSINGSNISPVKRIQNVTTDTNVEFRQPFRETNPKAVKTWKLDTDKKHSFKLVVKSGTLLLNFITNHMYYFQNAGVGGFQASDFLKSGVRSTAQEIIDFNPDLFIFESATNDANTWFREENGGDSTNRWFSRGDVFDFDFVNGNKRKIKLNKDLHGVNKGDVVIMGTYDGSINDVVVGIVDSVNTSSNMITFKSEVTSTINEKRCKIKSIKTWEDRVEQVVSKVTNGVGHKVAVGIGTSGVPNYYNPSRYLDDGDDDNDNHPRRLMGYREKGQMLASKNGWMFFDFFSKVKAFNPGVDTNGQWSLGDNTHPRNEGYRLFGSAITDVLKKAQ
jgi:hypothetical protein